MRKFIEMYVIGIDHGYGNMKTANCCFKTGLLAYDAEPLFTGDMLVYDGKYYLIGEGHKEFLPDKIRDEDYYILTLVAIAKELQREKLTEAKVINAAGLPLTWTSGQKKDFAVYHIQHIHRAVANIRNHIDSVHSGSKISNSGVPLRIDADTLNRNKIVHFLIGEADLFVFAEISGKILFLSACPSQR